MEAQGRTQRGFRRKRKVTLACEANAVSSVPSGTVEPPLEATGRGDRPRKVEVAKGSRQIVVSLERADYDRIWKDAPAVRQWVDTQWKQCPELFPAGMAQGYQLCGLLPESVKLPGVRLRQLKLKSDPRVKYTLRPSFVAPYLVGTVDQLDFALRLRRYGVP